MTTLISSAGRFFFLSTLILSAMFAAGHPRHFILRVGAVSGNATAAERTAAAGTTAAAEKTAATGKATAAGNATAAESAAFNRFYRPVNFHHRSSHRSSVQHSLTRAAEVKMISLEAIGLFEELRLADSGLDEKVLEYGLKGYHHLLRHGAIRNPGILSICDFSQPSSQKRMYVIDLRNRRLLYRTYVAHGEGSGMECAQEFSNQPESHKSSLGFYVTRNMYYGGNGLSLRIDGMDRGFNSLASERNIVIHGASYVSERILKKYGMMGTTFGCPAIPSELTIRLIPLLKDGSCFFIYAPSRAYLTRSSVLNG